MSAPEVPMDGRVAARLGLYLAEAEEQNSCRSVAELWRNFCEALPAGLKPPSVDQVDALVSELGLEFRPIPMRAQDVHGNIVLMNARVKELRAVVGSLAKGWAAEQERLGREVPLQVKGAIEALDRMERWER